MKVNVLIVDQNDKRHFLEMEGIATEVPELVLTPWLPNHEANRYAVTHVPTGRCANRAPMDLGTAHGFVKEVKDIDWTLEREEIVKKLAGRR